MHALWQTVSNRTVQLLKDGGFSDLELDLLEILALLHRVFPCSKDAAEARTHMQHTCAREHAHFISQALQFPEKKNGTKK